MASPQEYNNKIVAMGLTEWRAEASSSSEAQELLKQIRYFRNELWELKKGIKAEISIVWDQYHRDSKETAGSIIGGSFLAAFLGKQAAYFARGHSRQQLVQNRDQLIDSYRAVDAKIDDLLMQLDSANDQIQAFIARLKAEGRRAPYNANQSSYQTYVSVDYNEYTGYISSPEWRQKAEEAKSKAGYRCQVCNRSRTEVQLDAHHRTYERLGNELQEDITVLCRECHQLYEDAKKSLAKPTPESVTEPVKFGVCIRCKQSISLDRNTPYCYSCFRVWKQFTNLHYKEKYCHVCGKENPSTKLKPTCYECYRRNQ
jgi:5-methylcytosine-specific restriction endonuclease McrA